MTKADVLEEILHWIETRQRHATPIVEDVCVGVFWSVVRTSHSAGMASSPVPRAPVGADSPVSGAGELTGGATIDLARLARSESAIERAVGLAALNALLAAHLQGTTSDNARDLLLDRGKGRCVAMIGRFPFVARLQPGCEKLWVFEQEGTRRAGEYSAEDLEEVIPQADVVAVSAATLVNGTLPSILEWTRPESFLMMMGPSTPLCPYLFEAGFDVLCGTVIEDPDAVIRAASQGAVTGQITGVRRVCLWG